MGSDATNTAITGSLATFLSLVIAHLPEIQATITFFLTVWFLVYKIREARAKAKEAEEHQIERHKKYADNH